MKLRYTRRAVRDLAEIADYIREHNPQAALRVRDTILESLHPPFHFGHDRGLCFADPSRANIKR